VAGLLEVDEGTVQAGGSTLGYLRQEVEETQGHRTVVEEAMDAFAAIHTLHEEEDRILSSLERETDHTTARYARLLEDLDQVHQRLHATEAHTARPRAEAVLSGLGFGAKDMDEPVSTFSGGWRMRVELAKLLLSRPDVLLLDEPTNHLDIDSIAWLETYLKTYPGTVVIVSHDRYFLDRMVNRIAELSRGRVTEYAGNYAFYLKERAERRELQRASFVNQQKAIAETERFIERFRYKNTKATQVQSRIKALGRLDRITEPDPDEAAISFRFPEPPRSGRMVLELSRFSKTYVDEGRSVPVFREAGPLQIERGDKIALIGRNGAGKSTLARMLAGTEPFDGTRRLGKDVELTFFAQHTADTLDPGATVLEAVQRVAFGRSETEVRSLLGAFLFRGDDVFKPIRVLSGGEKSRVALATTLVVPANLLVLDEPTNHLDIHSIAVLIEALKQFTGTFAVVSHDRHFLDQVVTRVWRVEDGTVRVFPGTYSEYLWKVGQEAQPTVVARAKADAEPRTARRPAAAAPDAEEPRDPSPADPDNPFRTLNTFRLKRALVEAEREIQEHEDRKSSLEAALGDPSLYADADRPRETTEAYEAVQLELVELYRLWEAIAEAVAERGA
jgi:ATP-binding cassette subfamily F protein 3